MSTSPLFNSDHAEREIEHLSGCGEHRIWTDPCGRTYDLLIPPTVYPPREDTDLLAQTLHAERILASGKRCLEIGCGSGALSLFAAAQGCEVTACDINPFAVACTRHQLSLHGLRGRILEGGPGPNVDGVREQWGGDELYDVVVWNMPYIQVKERPEQMLGPLEEAAFLDTDIVGLYDRILAILVQGRLLSQQGVAYLLLSSLGESSTACEKAWSFGIAATLVANYQFEDDEEIHIVKLWHPFPGQQLEVHERLDSTNSHLLATSGEIGTSALAFQQTAGRGQHGRSWTSTPDAFMASWRVDPTLHLTSVGWHQLNIGTQLCKLLRYLNKEKTVSIQVKWPNDVYLRVSSGQRWKKIAGILYEAVTKGEETRLVVGIGMNLKSSEDDWFGGISQLGLSFTPLQMHVIVHALVASSMSLPSFDGFPSERHFEMIRLFKQGVAELGPIFYRTQIVEGIEIERDGSARILPHNVVVEQGDDLLWSNI